MLGEGAVIGGRYRLDALIGKGGMGVVWRATDLTLARPVALKILHPRGGEDRAALRERFLREARLSAAISHRNVVHIVDFGSTDDGDPFMAMELLEGESLASRMERSPPLTIEELLRVMVRVLRGLDAVHAAGIVHRDLKPENVFLVKELNAWYPKILDFGISRSLEGAERLSPHTSRDGGIIGTPHYMSPEQARGLRNIDARADLYSVAAIAYEVLVGRVPYDSPNLGDLIILIAAGGAPAVSALRPDVGVAVSAMIARALSVDPAARYQTAREMMNAIDAASVECGYEIGARGGGDISIRFRPVGVERRKRDSGEATLDPETIAAAARTASGAMAPIRGVEARGSDPSVGSKPRGRALALWGGGALLAAAAVAVAAAMSADGLDGGAGSFEPARSAGVDVSPAAPAPAAAASTAGPPSDVQAPPDVPPPVAPVQPAAVAAAPRDTGTASDAGVPGRVRRGARQAAPGAGMRAFRELDF